VRPCDRIIAWVHACGSDFSHVWPGAGHTKPGNSGLLGNLCCK